MSRSRPKPSVLECAIADYKKTGRPLSVNFRELAPFRSGEDRATHLIHPYPAKLLLNIPYLVFQSRELAPPDGRVLDPFCGSGTVLLEGLIHGMKVDGADSNPLARQIAIAKTRPIDIVLLSKQLEKIMREALSASGRAPDVVNREYWYSRRITKQLTALREAVLKVCTDETLPFFEVNLSCCARRVSFADPRISVPVRINPERAAVYGAKGEDVLRRFRNLRNIDAQQVFWSIAAQNITRMGKLEALLTPSAASRSKAIRVFEDSRSISVKSRQYDLIVTSPPYAGAQKYIRSSSLSLGWLGLTPKGELRSLERLSIGREHLGAHEAASLPSVGVKRADRIIQKIADRNPLRARIASTYLQEMRCAIEEMERVLKPGGHLVLVAGPNVVAGLPFQTPEYLVELSESVGLSLKAHMLDDIASRGLMVKRNKTASMIAQESVLVLQKSEIR